MTNKNDAGKTAAEHPVVRYVNQVRVRYNDTDRMSFVYHANYAMYFEVSVWKCCARGDSPTRRWRRKAG